MEWSIESTKMWLLLVVLLGGVLCDSTTETTDAATTTEVVTTTTSATCDDANCTTTMQTEILEANSSARGTHTKPKPSATLHDSNICTCNLQTNFCDINCCCDPDCSANDRSVFAYCQVDDNRYYDTRYCKYVKYLYVNNTRIEWEVNQDGWFCIVSSNLPKSYLEQREEPITSLQEAKPKKQFWRRPKNYMANIFPESKEYVYGDAIVIVKNASDIDIFSLPRNFVTKPCIFEDTVGYLKNTKNSCSQTILDDSNPKLNFTTFFENIRVVASPKNFNISKFKNNIFKNCPKNVCLEIEPKLCDAFMINCSQLGNTYTKFHCSYELRTNVNSCQNAVKKVHYKFYHNGTNGLVKVEVLGVLANFSYQFGGEDFDFVQHYSVEFLWVNQSKNYSEVLSGNPGYISGKPILIGTESSSVIQRNSTKFISNFLTFPENVKEECVRNETFYIPLEFGYNMISKCQMRKSFSFKQGKNASDVCKQIQSALYDLWGVSMDTNKSVVYGIYGNADTMTNSDWSKVLYRSWNLTQGIFTKNNNTLVCHNISTIFNVEVFYARVDFQTVLNQQKILGVVFDFNQGFQRHFALATKNDTVTFNVSLDLTGQVSFYDITGEKAKKFVAPPSLDIRLPYDFFYPFIKVDNGARGKKPSFVGCTVFLYFVLMC